MTRATTTLRIAAQQDQPTLSKGQKTFNTLVKKIETSRQSLSQWQATVGVYQQKIASEFEPLMREFKAQQGVFVRLLDQALDRTPTGKMGLTKAERRVVQELICELAEHLVVETGDRELKAIYNKYSDFDFDAEELEAAQSMKSTLQDMFGMEPEDEDEALSPQDLIRRLQEQMEKIHRQGIEHEEKRDQRKKTPKQLARDAKTKADAEQTSQSIREVYRKLVSALHPDREPDLAERERKTALMQRVNQAYDKKDLLRLLELQLELEHIDAQTIAGLSEERLKHFNKVLKEQLAELEQEIASIEMPLRRAFGGYHYLQLVPEMVMPMLLRDVAAMRRDVQSIKKEMLVVNDLVVFKGWIKARKQENKRRDAAMDDLDFPFMR